MEIVIGILIVAAIFAFFVHRSKKAEKAQALQTQEFWRDIDELNNEGTEANRRAWFPIFESLPVLEAATCPYIHLPVYDCRMDLFELPCAHHSYNSRYSDRGVGFCDGEYIRKWLIDFSISTSQGRPENDGTACVDSGDHFYLLRGDSLIDPGSYVWRIVRTGEDEYHVWGWQSGIRPSAADLDPPYFINDIARQPSLWLDRMDYVTQIWRFNSFYLSECESCEHRVSP